jgi:hypothetical protein
VEWAPAHDICRGIQIASANGQLKFIFARVTHATVKKLARWAYFLQTVRLATASLYLDL